MPDNGSINKLYESGGIIIKSVDMKHDNIEIQEQLDNEVKAYKALESLQGTVIPYMVLYFEDGVNINLITEACGRPIITWDKKKKEKAKYLLREIHKKGYGHGDVREPNFVIDGDDHDKHAKMRIIDFGLTEKFAELREIRNRETRKKEITIDQLIKSELALIDKFGD